MIPDFRDKLLRKILPVLLLVLTFAPNLSAERVKNDTLAAWTAYIAAKHNQPLKLFPLQRREARKGGIIVWPVAEMNPIKVPHGLIHDWVGVVFIPKVTVADALATSRGGFYDPTIARGFLSDSTGMVDHYSVLNVMHVALTTAAVFGEYEIIYIQIDPTHWCSVSQSTRLQAVENYGTPDERLDPPDQGPGYIWRMYSISSFEEADGGVYIEVEVVGLSRDVPFFFRWLVNPIISHLPEDSIRATLTATRDAIRKREVPHPVP